MRARGLRAGIPGSELPPAPEVPQHLMWVWRAFMRLSEDRPWLGGGMDAPVPGRIPWTVVRAWAEAHGMTNEEAEHLDRYIVQMDEVYAKHVKDTRSTTGAANVPEDKAARWDRENKR